jgi:hypothetical protein
VLGLAVDVMRISRAVTAESVSGGAEAPTQGIQQDDGYQDDHGNRDRRREAEDQDR